MIIHKVYLIGTLLSLFSLAWANSKYIQTYPSVNVMDVDRRESTAGWLGVWAAGAMLAANGIKDIGNGCFASSASKHEELKREVYINPDWFQCAAGIYEEAIGTLINIVAAAGAWRVYMAQANSQNNQNARSLQVGLEDILDKYEISHDKWESFVRLMESEDGYLHYHNHINGVPHFLERNSDNGTFKLAPGKESKRQAFEPGLIFEMKEGDVDNNWLFDRDYPTYSQVGERLADFMNAWNADTACLALQDNYHDKRYATIWTYPDSIDTPAHGDCWYDEGSVTWYEEDEAW